MENSAIYKRPLSGYSAASNGMPTNPVLPKMKANLYTFCRSPFGFKSRASAFMIALTTR